MQYKENVQNVTK